MGLGDIIHWSAVIRDLFKYINSCNDIHQKIIKINNIKKDQIDKYGFGIVDYNYDENNNNLDFKFLLEEEGNMKKNKLCNYMDLFESREVFKNNPYITDDENYPNLIDFIIMSAVYHNLENNSYIDDIHVVDRINKILGFDKFNIEYSVMGDIHFTKEEINKVEEKLPKEEYIFISPQGKLESRSYELDKSQEIIDNFKNIKFIQIIPNEFKGKSFDKLKNCICYQGDFTFRETLYFIKNAKLCILAHGGLSIGASCFNKKTICLYSKLFNPKMTKTENENVIEFIDNDHNYCYDNYCKYCIESKKKHDVNIVFELLEILFNN